MARTENPYDRREKSKRRDAHNFDEAYVPVDLLDDGRRAYPGLTLERLGDWMRDEYARGFNRGEGTTEAKYDEEILPTVKRTVWLEGHIAGWKDGRAELLQTIADQFERRAGALIESIEAAVDSPRTTRAVLREQAEEARRLLEQLVDAHHNGFHAEDLF